MISTIATHTIANKCPMNSETNSFIYFKNHKSPPTGIAPSLTHTHTHTHTYIGDMNGGGGVVDDMNGVE